MLKFFWKIDASKIFRYDEKVAVIVIDFLFNKKILILNKKSLLSFELILK